MTSEPNAQDLNLTWTSLLAQWMDFARASVALSNDAEGDRWRESVAEIIGLQAVTCALGDLDRLGTGDERALALDRSEVLIRKHARALNEIWRSESMDGELLALIADARRALSAAGGGGLEWRVDAERLVADHPAELLDLLVESGFAGDLWLPSPGFVLFDGSPAAFCRDQNGGEPDPALCAAIEMFLGEVTGPDRVPVPRQVYRQFDFGKGCVVRDLVAPLDETLPAGQPLLIPVMESGVVMPVHLPPRGYSSLEPVPVEFVVPTE